MDKPKPCPFCGYDLEQVREMKWLHLETGECFMDDLAIGGKVEG